MRKWMIDYFIGDPDEVSTIQEALFYFIMIFPLVMAIIVITIT